MRPFRFRNRSGSRAPLVTPLVLATGAAAMLLVAAGLVLMLVQIKLKRPIRG